jgi:hypothetical protein
MNRWLAIEHKTVPEIRAEQEALLRALRARGTQEAVYVANAFTGQTEVLVPDDAHPSPESGRLAEALAALADPDAEPPPSDLWTNNTAEVRQVRWLQTVDAALEAHMITTREWATLYDTFGRVGVARGWHSEASGKAWRALARRALGVREPTSGAPPPADRKAPPAAGTPAGRPPPATWEQKQAEWRAICEREGWGPRPRRPGLGLGLG